MGWPPLLPLLLLCAARRAPRRTAAAGARRHTETQLRNGWKRPLHKKLFSFLQMKNGGQAAAN